MGLFDWLKRKREPSVVHLRREGEGYSLEIEGEPYELSDRLSVARKIAAFCPKGANVIYVPVLGTKDLSVDEAAEILVIYRKKCPGARLTFEGLASSGRRKSDRNARVSGLENLDKDEH